MAVSESVLNAVNLFSSTSVFNANKGSVGATDLNFIKQTTAELATEGGGIIAQSLGTNGYVKFANGLILQWGMQSSQQSNGKTGDWAFPNSRNVSFTYPLKCNSTVAVIPMCRLNSPTSNNPAINMGAFYRAATGAGFIHYSSISWEQTVTWYACYVAFCV